MASKRRPDKDLNHDNWADEDEPEEQGEFQRAPVEELKSRKILVPKRKLTASTSQQSNPFSALNMVFCSEPPAVVSAASSQNGLGSTSEENDNDDSSNGDSGHLDWVNPVSGDDGPSRGDSGEAKALNSSRNSSPPPLPYDDSNSEDMEPVSTTEESHPIASLMHAAAGATGEVSSSEAEAEGRPDSMNEADLLEEVDDEVEEEEDEEEEPSSTNAAYPSSAVPPDVPTHEEDEVVSSDSNNSPTGGGDGDDQEDDDD